VTVPVRLPAGELDRVIEVTGYKVSNVVISVLYTPTDVVKVVSVDFG
jgi:hypothetical protein